MFRAAQRQPAAGLAAHFTLLLAPVKFLFSFKIVISKYMNDLKQQPYERLKPQQPFYQVIGQIKQPFSKK